MTKPSQPATIIGGPASPFVRKVLAVCEMKGVPYRLRSDRAVLRQ